MALARAVEDNSSITVLDVEECVEERGELCEKLMCDSNFIQNN